MMSCNISFCFDDSPKISSIIPMLKMSVAPITMGISDGSYFINKKQALITPVKIPMPPTRGVGLLCAFLFSGRSSNPNLIDAFLIKGVVTAVMDIESINTRRPIVPKLIIGRIISEILLKVDEICCKWCVRDTILGCPINVF